MTAADVWQEYRWTGSAPEGYGTAQVILYASAPGDLSEDGDAPLAGEIHVDEVVCLSTGAGSGALVLDEVSAQPIGDPASALVVHKIDRLLLTGVHPEDPSSGDRMTFSASAGDYGIPLKATDGNLVWVFTAAPALVQGGISTMGSEGYLARRLDFDAEGVTDLVLGTGTDLVRLVLGGDCQVQGRQVGSSFRLVVRGVSGEGPTIKTRFADDFKAALVLASEAKAATREGRVGDALNKWKALLDRYPYEAKDVAEADSARAALLRGGVGAIKELQEDLERARFFQLKKGFEDCAARAEELAASYANSELAEPIAEVSKAIEEELKGFVKGDDPGAGHMGALLEVLQKQGALDLVQYFQGEGQE